MRFPTWRVALALAVTLFLSVVVVRQALVTSNLASNPERAAWAWSGHPDAVVADRMAAIGKATSAGRPVDRSLTFPVIAAAPRAPLAPEPFLVRGIELQGVRDEDRAGEAFQAAVARDPRSVAAHFFLADHYGRIGKPGPAMAELGRVIRLMPGGSWRLAPQIAKGLRSPGALPAVRALVADNPTLRDDLLRSLATNAGNADLIAALAPAGQGVWVPTFVDSLVAAGAYDRAFHLWRRNAPQGVETRGLLIDPRFAMTGPPPFGWQLASDGQGVAEAADGSGLHVVYFGRDRFVAASQLLRLPAGRHRLAFAVTVAVGNAGLLRWQVTCLPSAKQIGSTVLGTEQGIHLIFAVPDQCPAQRLELVGTPADTVANVDATIRNVEFRPVP